MTTTISEVFTLEPQDNARLQSLCGPFDEHISLIEKQFNLIISRRNFTFTLESADEESKPHHAQLLKNVAKLIQRLYVETAMVKGKVNELDLEQIHLAIQESRMLLQQVDTVEDDEAKVFSTTIKTKRGVIKPRGKNQIQYLHNILRHDISFGIGPAGTGKTFLAVAAAVEALEKQQVRRLLLTRPAVEAGEKLGFLPGDLAQKIDPYLRPLYDALFEMLGFEKVQKLMERNVIEIAPLAYMRGRTLDDAFVILDEAQNTTVAQMKMFLTRLGYQSKMIVNGDTSQIDLPRGTQSGLVHAERTLKQIKKIAFVNFEASDVVRHPVVAEIIKAYEKADLHQE